MLEKKYVFETNKTRLRRVFINSILLGVTFILVFTTIGVSIPIYGQREYKQAQAKLYKKTPDLVAIYTGGAGRIAFGLEVSKSYPNSKIFISGVYNKNTVKTLIEKQVKPHEVTAGKKLEKSLLREEKDESLKDNEKLSDKSKLIEIDYQARNTLENVIYTLHFLRKTNEHKHIVIVSSDYHIMRIKWLMENLMSPTDDFDFTYLGMETDYSNLNSIKLVMKEAIKLVKTSFVLLFWNNENIPEELSTER